MLSPPEGAFTTPTPTFKLKATDPDGDRLKFEIEILEGGQVIKTFEQTKDTKGWSKEEYESGEEARFTAFEGEALSWGESYKWGGQFPPRRE